MSDSTLSPHRPEPEPERGLLQPGPALPAWAERLQTALLAADTHGRIIWRNPAATDLFGGLGFAHSLQQLFGQTAERLLACGHDGACPCTLRASPLPGSQAVVDCSATAFGDGGVLLEMHPVNWHLERDREQARARQSQAAARLLRHLSHEIKNPLGGLRGAAQLLDRELSQQIELQEYTRLIIREADRLSRLIDSLGQPIHRLRRRASNLHSLIEHVIRLVDGEFPELEHQRDYDPSIPEFQLDQDQLMQVLLNLARNACQANAKRLTWRSRIAHRVVIDGESIARAVALSLSDNGQGFPPELADRLFEPLFSIREDGRGLGLAISQNIVAAHGGKIVAKDTGLGARIDILLPLVENT